MIIYLCLFVIDFFIIKCKKVPSSADAEEKNDDFIQVCRAMQETLWSSCFALNRTFFYSVSNLRRDALCKKIYKFNFVSVNKYL